MNDCKHTQEFHTQCVKQLCRLCGERSQTAAEKKEDKSFLCADYKDLILHVFSIDISQDENNDYYPDKICHHCYNILHAVKRNNTIGSYDQQRKIAIDLENSLWVKPKRLVSIETCLVCLKIVNTHHGGRRKKRKRGRPKVIPNNLGFNHRDLDVFHLLVENFPDINTDDYGFTCLTEHQRKHFVCVICDKMYNPRAVVTKCEHVFCSACLTSVFTKGLSNVVSCPICDIGINFSDVKPVDLKFREQLLSLQVQCIKCKYESELSFMPSHLCQKELLGNVEINSQQILTMVDSETLSSGPLDLEEVNNTDNIIRTPPVNSISSHATSAEITTQTSPSLFIQIPPSQGQKMSESSSLNNNKSDNVSSLLHKAIDEPLDQIEEKILTHAVKRKLFHAKDKRTIRCKTRGQVSMFSIIR